MAWLKEIAHPTNGAIAAYWEVIGINYSHRLQLSSLSVGGWISEDAYNAGLEPIIEKAWQIPAGLAPELAAGALAFVTAFARGQDEFTGSEDA